ncbi:hypothetical protein HHI36_006077 [Cryptolaemus montrouzieri]|uniref:Uncharacterized protein n=1 Tax=Cryptolaemus montrouzieri TaxID=559131 RepID=A0ABD2NW61_9CUCU
MKVFKNCCRFFIAVQYRQLYCTPHLTTVIKVKEQEETDSAITPKNGKRNIIRNVQSLLDISYIKALNIVNENTKLVERNTQFLTENYAILKENGIDNRIIMKYPMLLGVPFLDEAVRDLKTLPYPLSDTIVLSGLVKPKLDKLINSYKKQDDKIELLSKSLQIPPDEVCETLYNRDFLISRNSEALGELLKLITDVGIPMEELRKDLWVLKYSAEKVRLRLNLIKDLNIDLPKPWMIRSPISVIENYARRRTDNREILGNDSLVEYLSKKLECTEAQAKYLIDRIPALTTKKLRTLSDIINFLYSKGFEPYHIIRVPKILVHSVETIKSRLEQLEKAGVRVESLYIFIKTQKQFIHYFETLVKKKTI